jgi:hypothetical protein
MVRASRDRTSVRYTDLEENKGFDFHTTEVLTPPSTPGGSVRALSFSSNRPARSCPHSPTPSVLYPSSSSSSSSESRYSRPSAPPSERSYSVYSHSGTSHSGSTRSVSGASSSSHPSLYPLPRSSLPRHNWTEADMNSPSSSSSTIRRLATADSSIDSYRPPPYRPPRRNGKGRERQRESSPLPLPQRPESSMALPLSDREGRHGEPTSRPGAHAHGRERDAR